MLPRITSKEVLNVYDALPLNVSKKSKGEKRKIHLNTRNLGAWVHIINITVHKSKLQFIPPAASQTL